MDEVAKIMQQWRADEAGKLAEMAKGVFPGAVVDGIEKRDRTATEVELNDEIPF
jgi:hypothetical protein